MPNRIIKESIHSSEKVNQMTDFQFRLWISLITYVDDYGRGDARPAIIKGTCFPLRERLTTHDIDAGLQALADIGCIDLYEIDGRPYLCLPGWASHQRVRNAKEKFPAPPEHSDNSPRVAASCGETPRDAEKRREPRPESNPNPNPNPNPKETPNGVCAAPESDAPPAADDAAGKKGLPLIDGTEYLITAAQLAEWQEIFPAIDVAQQLRTMRSWLIANPKNRKTRGGILRFVHGWLSKEQNRAPRVQAGGGGSTASAADTDAAEMMKYFGQLPARSENA